MQGTDKPPAQEAGRGKQEIGSRRQKPKSNNVVDYYFEHLMLAAADIINKSPGLTEGLPATLYRCMWEQSL